MPPQLIIQLLATFGPSAIALIDSLITKWQNQSAVTPEEWATLSAALRLSARDHLAARLSAAGIALDSPLAKTLLELAGK